MSAARNPSVPPKPRVGPGFGLSADQAERFGIPFEIGPNGEIIPIGDRSRTRLHEGSFNKKLRLAFEEGRDPTEFGVKGRGRAQIDTQKELERLQKAQIQQLKIQETEAKVEAGGRARSIRKAKKSGGGSRALLTTGTNSSSIGPRNG